MLIEAWLRMVAKGQEPLVIDAWSQVPAETADERLQAGFFDVSESTSSNGVRPGLPAADRRVPRGFGQHPFHLKPDWRVAHRDQGRALWVCGSWLAVDGVGWRIERAVIAPAAMAVLRQDDAAAEADDQQRGNQHGKSTVHGVSSWVDRR